MIINNKFKGVVKLTSDQYQELKTVGYIVIDGKKYEYDPYSTLYMTDSTVTAVLYTPQELTEEQKLQARTNIGAGTSNFSGSYNDLTDKPEISEPIAEAIRDNTTQIVGENNSFSAGNSNVNATCGVGIGYAAKISSNGAYGIAIGNQADVQNGLGIAIGADSKVRGNRGIAFQQFSYANADYSIQFGNGENNKAHSLQIEKDNIYDAKNHVATFQNLQIDGVDEYPTLSGADAPTITTVGKVKQFYVETTTPALYYCSSITGTGTTEDPYVYNWTQAGGTDEELRNNTVQIVPTSGGLAIGGAFKPSDASSIAIGRNDARALGNGDTAIGNHAICYTTGSYKIAIGNNSWANKHASIAIGHNAKADASQAIQLGPGENKTDYSLQISADNIYKYNTHTLTVQNIEQNGNPVLGILSGETDPTGATVGAVGQFYISTATDPASLWLCTKVETVDSTTTYTWTKQGGISQEDFDKLVNNETKIKTSLGGFSAGNNSKCQGFGGSIGYSANTSNGGSIGYEAVSSNGGAVGSEAKAGHGGAVGWGAVASAGFAGGYNAKTVNEKTNIDAVQLGTGTNSKEKTMQVYDDNIYDANTHTLTVQNIEQNGNSVYGILSGTSAPTSDTVGSIGQFYIETTTPTLYYCSAITTGDTTTYTWTPAGGKKLYQHNIALAVGATDIYSISGFAQIITNDNNSFTSETLLQWLKDNGYNSRSNMLNTVLMSKYVYSFNQELPNVFIGLYVSNNMFMSTALRTTLTLKEIAIIDNESISAYTDRTADLSSSGINVNVVYDTVTEL